MTAATAPTSIGAAPPVPDSSVAEPDFDSAFEALLTWLKVVLTPGINALATNAYSNALSATADAILAQTAAGQAGNYSTAAGTAATAAADSAAIALAAETSAASLVNKYLDIAAIDPTVGRNGVALVDGNWYVNTVSGLIRVYTVSAGWKNGISAIAGVDSINGLQGPITSPTQAEAEAGVEAAKPMNALRVKQAIAAQRALASQAEAEAGTENTKMMTPQRVAQAIAVLTPKSFQIGDILTTGQTLSAPTWLPCDESIYLQSSYPELYAKLGNIPNGVESVSGGNLGVPSSAPYTLYKLGNNVIAVPAMGNIWYSTNAGVSWQDTGKYFGSGSKFMIAGDKAFLATTSGYTSYEYSTNLTAWTYANFPTNSGWSIYYNPATSVYLAIGSGTLAYASNDGVNNWTSKTLPASPLICFVLNSKFLLVTNTVSTTRYTSDYGTTWVTNTGSSFDASTMKVVDGVGYVPVYSGNANGFRTTADGITLDSRIIYSDYIINLASLVKSGNYFYALSIFYGVTQPSQQIVRSSNLTEWHPIAMYPASTTIPSIVVAANRVLYTFYNQGASTFVIPEFTYNTGTQFVTPKISSGYSQMKTYIKAK